MEFLLIFDELHADSCQGNAGVLFGDRKGTTKQLCGKDFAERSGELSGAICFKTLVLLGNDR